MTFKVIRLKDQAKGQFNGGAILENKPIGFPQDGGSLKPYSNLFYWAHAWTPGERSLIGEHPHQGFEIMSFVLKGSIEHYDSKNKDWRKLNEGDAQIIRAGSGITHAELVNKESEFFQIWLDPDLNETLRHEPSYSDYPSAAFPVVNGNGRITKVYKGDGSPMSMFTEGVEIMESTFEKGSHDVELDADKLYSIYVLEGNIKVDDQELSSKDYMIVSDMESLKIGSENTFRLFIISSPVHVAYKTYRELVRA